MSSSTPETRAVHTHELLDRNAAWLIDEGRSGLRDFERLCVFNAAISFRRDRADISLCLLISAGASHLASIEASGNTLTVIVYLLDDGFQRKWITTHVIREDTSPKQVWSLYERTEIHGGITEDGESVVVLYQPKGGKTKAFTVTRNGFTDRLAPAETGSEYSYSTGEMSEDGEHLFYTGRGNKFGGGGEGKVVEVYSMRNLVKLKAMTFSYGDGRHLRNV
jgi:hypothetical protein